MTRLRVAAVVLAAGASTRMGRPKALVQWRGRSFVRHAVAQAHAAGCEPIVVVQGATALAELAPARIVDNPDWARGPTTSLRVGLGAALAQADGVVVLTVDRPHVDPATVRALVQAWRGDPHGVWQPEHAGRRGHPIVYPADVARELASLPDDASPRAELARPELATRRRTLAVDDPAVLDNLDRPEDLAALSSAAMDLSAIAGLHPTYDETRRLLVLELDHGKANEMGSEQLGQFAALCELLESDASPTCLCTTSRRVSSRGTPLFIAGANVTERTGWDDARIKQHVVGQRALMRRLRRLPLFTVALSHGVTLGWGTEFLLTADYAIATPAATFGLPETGLGILPGARGTAELALLVGPAQALRLGCVGETVDADEALRIGLVQERVADLDAGLSRVRAMAERLCLRSPTAIAAYKQALLDGLGRAEQDRLALEQAAYERTVDTGEAAIGRAAFAEIRDGRAPVWGPRRT